MQLGEVNQTGDCLATNLFLPQWWVQAYENALRAQHEGLAYSHFTHGGTLPLAAPFEVYVLSYLLSYLQTIVLANGVDRGIILDPLAIERQVGAKLFQSTQSVKRVVLALGGLRLIDSDSDRTRAVSLFTDQAIERTGDGFVLRLEPNSNYIESFFGYIDAYRELSRQAQGKTTLRALCSEEPPLLIWKSIWLDMRGVEQALLLRLERAMQWQYRMVHVDGVYSENLRDLFTYLKLGPNGHRLSQKIITLKRFSKKLIDHGVLSIDVPKEYLAYGQEENGIQYLWRVSRMRAQSLDLNQYRQTLHKAWQRIFASRYTSDFLSLVACRMPLANYEAKIKRLLDVLENETQASGYDACLPLEGNLLLSLKHLYLEWLIRSMKGHPFPLPDKIKETKIFPLVCQLDDSEEVIRRLYGQYLRELQRDLSYWDMLEHCPMASLTTKSTWQVKAFSEFITASKPSHERIVVQTPAQPLMQSMQPIELKKPLNDEKQALKGVALRQTADAELEKLLRLKNDAYAGLTQAYIKSLDPRSQKMFVDIRKQMQPKMFDRHIKERLLQFMIENPEKWTPSAEVH